VDDGTDDCAFGAMMSLAPYRAIFRKLRFQMIADTEENGKCRENKKADRPPSPIEMSDVPLVKCLVSGDDSGSPICSRPRR
jgi:hypothetical protein